MHSPSFLVIQEHCYAALDKKAPHPKVASLDIPSSQEEEHQIKEFVMGSAPPTLSPAATAKKAVTDSSSVRSPEHLACEEQEQRPTFLFSSFSHTAQKRFPANSKKSSPVTDILSVSTLLQNASELIKISSQWKDSGRWMSNKLRIQICSALSIFYSVSSSTLDYSKPRTQERQDFYTNRNRSKTET